MSSTAGDGERSWSRARARWRPGTWWDRGRTTADRTGASTRKRGNRRSAVSILLENVLPRNDRRGPGCPAVDDWISKKIRLGSELDATGLLDRKRSEERRVGKECRCRR